MPEKLLTIRTYLCFWILGLCNNIGYVVILSAAHDILKHFNKEEDMLNRTPSEEFNRQCNEMSTGAILLADIVPSIIAKLISPFCPLHMNLRMSFVIILALSGYLLVAMKFNYWIVIFGVILMSLSSGLGEVSLLVHTVLYKKEAISGWSSGTGGAGVLGTMSYAGLSALGVKSSTTMYLMSIFPLLMAITFWIILGHPIQPPDNELTTAADLDKINFINKLKLIPKVTSTFMLPYGMVYFFEYFINQGIFELMEFHNVEMSLQEQYRWYNFDYQLGVFVSRSSMSIIEVNNLWLLAVLQAFNVVITVLEAIYSFLMYIYILFLVIFWEGLIGGCCYVNTFRRISAEMPPEQRAFSVALTSLGDAIGITLAGITAMHVHNIICKIPRNK